MPVIAIPLAGAMVALAALFVLYAYWQLMSPIGQQLSNVPVIGGLLGNAFSWIMQAYYSAVGWAAQAAGGLVAAIVLPFHIVVATFQSVFYAFGSLHNNLVWIWRTGIAQQIQPVYHWIDLRTIGIEAWALTLFAQVYTWIDDRTAGIENWALALFAQVYHWIDLRTIGIEAWALTQFTQVYTWIDDRTAGIENWASAQFTQVYTWIDDRTAGIENWASAQFTQVYQWIDQRTVGIENWARDQIGAEAQTRAAEIEQALQYAAAGDAALAIAIQAIEDLPCIRQCSTLGSLGADLSELADLAFIAGLIAWAGSSVRDPQAAAGDAVGFLRPMAQPADDLLTSLMGL